MKRGSNLRVDTPVEFDDDRESILDGGENDEFNDNRSVRSKAMSDVNGVVNKRNSVLLAV